MSMCFCYGYIFFGVKFLDFDYIEGVSLFRRKESFSII